MQMKTINATVITAANGTATYSLFAGDHPQMSRSEIQISFYSEDANPTAGVEIKPLGAPSAAWKTHIAPPAFTEASTAMIQSPSVEAFKLTFAAGGDEKEIKITTTLRTKSI